MKKFITVTIASVVVAAAAILISVTSSPFSQEASSPAQTAQRNDTPAAERQISTLHDLNDAFVDIASRVNPAVVTVFTERVLQVQTRSPFFDDFFSQFFGRDPRQGQPDEREFRQRGLGSGVIVDSDGIIITNNHVIADADTINVRLMDGRTVPAKVLGADPKTDIAVIQVDEKGLPQIALGNSDKLRVGEFVLAIGSPLSANLAHSVTTGIVSAKGRSNVGLADYEDFIQTDAAINPGNSGGALVNVDGELVGINTAIASRSGGYQGVGFAVPVNMARHVMESIIEHGSVVRGWLGVYIQDINETMAQALDLDSMKGALVADVPEDGPAAKAGLKSGDIVIALNGEPVDDTARFRNAIASMPPGSKVKLEVLRDGKKRTFDVTLGTLDEEQQAAAGGDRLQTLFGAQLATLNGDLARQYGIRSGKSGVVVTGVEPEGPAARAGMRDGDLIVAINRRAVDSLGTLQELTADLHHGDSVVLQVIRRNRGFFVALRL